MIEVPPKQHGIDWIREMESFCFSQREPVDHTVFLWLTIEGCPFPRRDEIEMNGHLGPPLLAARSTSPREASDIEIWIAFRTVTCRIWGTPIDG